MPEAILRLREVPWAALAGLAPALERAIAEVLAGTAAERVLDRLLRAHRGLGAEGRAAMAEAVFGVGLWRRRLAAHLGNADAPPRLLLASLLRDLGGVAASDAERLAGVAPGALPPLRPPPAALADRASLPDWLAAILVAEAGEDAGPLADALNLPAPVCLRVNPLRVSRDALAARLAAEGVPTRPGRFAPGALVVTTPRPNLYGAPSFREGWFEVQDEASQLVATLVGARPGDAVLDLCAGAGGKTLALAGAVGPGGTVHAADPDADALGRLRVRAARAGAGSLVVLHGAAPPASLIVDAALVDAPCSALGPLRRGPDLRWRLDPATFAALPALQGELLARAARHVRPGGRLVYATCTFRREENEDVALRFERDHPFFRRVLLDLDPAVVTRDGFLRTWPHGGGLDGFFAAVYVPTR
jgi:16S rRNA (cytosine967-C5)-methyltransferase